MSESPARAAGPEFLRRGELTAPDVDRIASVLESLRTVPELGSRYEGVAAPTTLAELAGVPSMTKVDLQTALAHLSPRARTGATWLFQSGGSTGAPQVGYAPTGLYMAEVYQQWKDQRGRQDRGGEDAEADEGVQPDR